jgi:HrpA-like RNA helicase
VGYSIQLESKRSKLTKLLYCTTGVLLRLAENDPLLSNISHIIVDEVHERSLDSDFLLIVLKKLLKKRRDVKVILMSATMNAELFAEYFNNCCTLYIPGRTYPIQILHLEDIVQATGYVCHENSPYARPKNCLKNNSKSDDQSEKLFDSKKFNDQTIKTLSIIDERIINYELIVKLLKHITESDKEDFGSILIFMPGINEISQLYNIILSNPEFNDKKKFIIIPLHSSLSSQNQQKVFEKPKPGLRKIVISTNIAETSITIDDCTVVIDTGRMKQTQYSPQSKMSSLIECWISRANALQRSGRAGRVKPGKCFRLYTKLRYETKFKEQQVPEIFRISLESLCLSIKALKMGSIEEVLSEALEPPSSEAIKSSIRSLIHLGALDFNEELRPLGAHLSKIPLDVQLAKMILYASMLQCLDPVLTIAASMGNQSPFLSPINEREEAKKAQQKLAVEKSDHLTFLKAYHQWTMAVKEKSERVFCNVHYLSNNAFIQICQRKKQFMELLADIGFVKIVKWHNNQQKEHKLDDKANRNSKNLAMVKACLVAGLYPNVAFVTEKDKDLKVMTLTDGIVHIHPSSILFQDSLFDNKYLIYLEKVKTSKLFIRDATMITPYSLMLFGGNLSFEKESGQLSIDKWIKFRVDKQIAILMDQLRIKLSIYLERLIKRQYEQEEATNEELEEENSLIMAIAELLGTEHSIHNFEDWWSSTKSDNKH